ncbi:MAG: ABC transporter permease subunit [Clostridia bacterium]|nr:ABC transporter permease subunit [Clostridia bacterium]
MKKRFTLTYEQVEHLKKRQSRALIVIGCIMVVLSILGISLNISGARTTLTTRQALTSGAAKQFQAMKNDRDILPAGEDLASAFKASAEKVALEKQNTLTNQRAASHNERDYKKFTSRMEEYDRELTAFYGEIDRLNEEGALSAYQASISAAISGRISAHEKYEEANSALKLLKRDSTNATKAYNKASKEGSGSSAEEIAALLEASKKAEEAYTVAENEKNALYAAYSNNDAIVKSALASASAVLPKVSFFESVLLFFSAPIVWAIFAVLGIELVINGAVCLKIPKLTPLSVLADILIYDFFVVLGSIMLAPLLYVAVGSFSSTGLAQFRFGKVDFSAYKMIAFSQRTMRSIGNSFLITIVGTIINIAITSITAYALSKRDLPGRKWMMKLVVVFMLFHAGLIPDYILVANTLGLTNTYWAIWLPVIISSSNLIIMKNFFQQLPESIEESARIDGCNEIQSFIHIVIPMSMASIATFSLFYAVGHWNNYQRAMIYISDPNKYPITVLLRQVVILSQGSLADDVLPEVQVWAPTNSVKYATIMVGTVPIICVYPFLQKHFTKGVLLGSVKG